MERVEQKMDQHVYEEYIAILKEELVPALGCTEPIAIAYAATAGKFNRLEKWTKAGKIKSRIYREWYSDHKTCE